MRPIFYLSVLLISLLFIVSCQNDDDPEPNNNSGGNSGEAENINGNNIDNPDSLNKYNKDGFIVGIRFFSNTPDTNQYVLSTFLMQAGFLNKSGAFTNAGTLTLNGNNVTYSDSIYEMDTFNVSGLNQFKNQLQVNVSGSNQFPSLSYDLNNGIPSKTKIDVDTLNKNSSYSFNFTKNFSGSDSINVHVSGKNTEWEKTYAAPVSDITIPQSELQKFQSDTLDINLNEFRIREKTLNEKNIVLGQATLTSKSGIILK